jgi:hypothetical protein
MSAHRTTRRAMLAGATSLSAAALGAGTALAAPTDQELRLIASRTFDLSEIGAPFAGVFLPAGLSFPDLVDKFVHLRERLAAFGAEWREYIQEHGGKSYEAKWQEIRDEELLVIDAILALKPRTFADITWQVEAAAEGAGVAGDDWMESLTANLRALGRLS